jgi:alpha-beta hydrolase superfamily lysophospholipase
MSRITSLISRLALLMLIAVLVVLAGSWLLAGPLMESANHAVAPLPAELRGRAVQFHSASGAQLKGWFIAGTPGRGAVVLLHGVRADQSGMYRRARFLSAAGYAVLVFDFQAHGESIAPYITFGFLESRDAAAAVEFLRRSAPGERIGVIGLSMGAAAAVLAEPPLPVDAMVLEEAYPTIEDALANRLRLQHGAHGGALVPLFTWQMPLRLGFGAASLRPIEHIAGVRAPKLMIAGAQDLHTTLAESDRLFAAAREPKEYWVVAGAGHEDIHLLQGDAYETRVLAFLGRWLNVDQATAH